MSIFFKDIRVGTIVSFRYRGKDSHDPAPMVMVISYNWQNSLHGLNIRYLRPDHLAKLQWIFKTPKQKMLESNPFLEDLAVARQASQQNYQNAVADNLTNTTVSVIKPQQGFGGGLSSFGNQNTFTRTGAQVQQVPAIGLVDPKNAVPNLHGALTQDQVKSLEETLRKMLQMKNASETPMVPYNFYHQYVKAILHPHTKEAYRKYKHTNIQNLRLVKESSAESARARTNFEREIQEISTAINNFYSPKIPMQKKVVSAKPDPLYKSREQRLKARKASQAYWQKKRGINQ